MTFDEVLAQVIVLLQREGRLSYRALKRRFDLDDEYLDDIKDEIIEAKQLAVDENGKVLVWTGSLPPGMPPVREYDGTSLAQPSDVPTSQQDPMTQTEGSLP